MCAVDRQSGRFPATGAKCYKDFLTGGGTSTNPNAAAVDNWFNRNSQWRVPPTAGWSFWCDPDDCSNTVRYMQCTATWGADGSATPACAGPSTEADVPYGSRNGVTTRYETARCKFTGRFSRGGGDDFTPLITANVDNTIWDCQEEDDGGGPHRVLETGGTDPASRTRCRLAVEDCIPYNDWHQAKCQMFGQFRLLGGGGTTFSAVDTSNAAQYTNIVGDYKCDADAANRKCTLQVQHCILSLDQCQQNVVEGSTVAATDAPSTIRDVTMAQNSTCHAVGSNTAPKSVKYCLKHGTTLDNVADLEDITNYGEKRLCKERQIYHIPGTVSGTFLIFQFIMFVAAIAKPPAGKMKTVYVWLAHVNLIMLLFFCMWMAQYTTTLFTKNVICWGPETLSEAYYLKKAYEGVGKYCYMYDNDVFSSSDSSKLNDLLGQRMPTDPLRHEFQVGVVSAYIGSAFGIVAMLCFLIMALKDDSDSGQFADAPSMQLTTHQPAIGAKV